MKTAKPVRSRLGMFSDTLFPEGPQSKSEQWKRKSKMPSKGAVKKRSPKGSATKTPAGKIEKKGKGEAKPRGGAAIKRPYPIYTVKEALRIAQVIKEFNGGNPWTPSDVANALNMGMSNNFFYLTAASRDYGFTEGTRDTVVISIAPLGADVLYASNADVEHNKKIEAFRRIPIFDKVLEHYKGSSLPEMKYLGNTLEREFQLAPKFHEEFSKMFRENCTDLGVEGGSIDFGTLNAPDGERPPTVILGGPKGSKNSLKAFIIMPFTERNPERPDGFSPKFCEAF